MTRLMFVGTLLLPVLLLASHAGWADEEARDRAIRRMLASPPSGASASATTSPSRRGSDRAAPHPAATVGNGAGIHDGEPDPSVPLEPLLGKLAVDGPATPEQVSLYMPVDDALHAAATASVRYRDGDRWVAAHPLFRIWPQFALKPEKAPSALAGIVSGLSPNVSYTIEVTVRLGGQRVVRTIEAKTRALPGAAPAPTKTIEAGTDGGRIQSVLDSAKPGDVILFRNGTYQVDRLTLARSGSPARPIWLRGESRDGTKLVDRSGRVLYLTTASHLVIEDLTLEGSGVDGGTAAESEGIRAWDGHTPENVTIRRLRIVGVDKGIVGQGDMAGFLVYDNTLIGNNVFRKDMLESNITWNDDGIRVPGRGHAVFNNTLSGFGDALAMSSGVENVGVHFYRNRILFSGDDAFEGDYGTRNISFHDNRIQNAMTLASFDPLYSGPAFVFRNSAINLGRQPYKLNNKNTGMFFYNNTVVRIPGYRSGAAWGWVQSNNGSLRAWGYRNNLLVFHGDKLLALESSGNDPIDFDHNGWYPDGTVWWTRTGGSFRSLTAARSRLRPTTPVFGESRYRHEHDVIVGRNPFARMIRFGASYDVPITEIHEPALAPDSRARNAGVEIPGITDGYSGSQPDIGAVISGRPMVQIGDRSR